MAGRLGVSNMEIMKQARRAQGWSFLASALALALSMNVSGRVMAQETEPGPPTEDKIWGGCELGAAKDAIETALSSSGNVQPNVSIVVVYSLEENDGQEIGESGTFTGPVICIDETAVDILERPQSARIPNSGTATTLDAEEAFVLRYELPDESVEKILCHSVENGVSCYRIFPRGDS